ncbi:uncharacterized protein LOC107647263 [Arachis ipaensis]|uniref:uncharacterized protein LOC107647263 n=1 Tax=Arachis ipaensis TaxID=130454 RepID=UPI0007AF0915|nr:uncharacterized protein LOC107647263 [Arachis ipaensis]
MNVHNSKGTIPWRPPMFTSTVLIKALINKGVIIIKGGKTKGSINAISLRSGTILQERSSKESKAKEATIDEDIVEVENVEDVEEVQEVVEEKVAQVRKSGPKEEDVLKEAMPIPFPTLAKRTKKQVELDPKMINELETIHLGSSISALMDAIPEKCGDLGLCLVSCTIDDVEFVDCMCDLGACVSIMHFPVYNELDLPPLKRSAARFVLADKSIISVAGIAEDVLVSSKGLTFPIDFYILEIPPNDSGKPSSILLGRPFLKTSRFKLDAFLGTYSFEIDGRTVSFNLDETIKHPPVDCSIFWCDLIDDVIVEIHHETPHEMSMSKGLSVEKNSDYDVDFPPPPLLQEDSNEELQPFFLQSKCASLEEDEVIEPEEVNTNVDFTQPPKFDVFDNEEGLEEVDEGWLQNVEVDFI